MRLVLGPRYVLIAYSCSQLFDRLVCAKVAVDRTKPNGRVLGVDIIPAQPPKGVSTIQGNFLSTEVQEYVQDFLRDPWRGRPYQDGNLDGNRYMMPATGSEDLPRHALKAGNSGAGPKSDSELGTVDVVLSDMSAPWPQISGFWKRSLSQPYHRMMNTSGVSFRDHVRSMVCAFRNEKIANSSSTLIFTSAVRTYASLHYSLVIKPSRLVEILSASSTKEPKIKN